MSCYLSRLTLSHFRSHQRTELALDGRPVALFGPNGSGKTNVLEAVSLFSPGRGLRRAAPDEMARRPQALGWKLRADFVTPRGPRRAESWTEPGQPRQLRLDDKAAAQLALGEVAAMLWLTPAMDRLWLDAAEARRRFLDRIALSFRPDHGAQVLAYDKAMRERNRLLRDGVGDARWHAALEARMAEAGAQMTANRRAALDHIGAHADHDGAFPVATLALECTAPDTAAGLAAALADGRGRDMAAGRSVTGPHRADLAATWAARAMPAAQCSTGEQKALLISVVLANARALHAQQGVAPILLLDEVAAHLDADRRAALHDAVCAMGAQCFMTGTGAELFADLGARAQAFALQDAGGASTVHEVTP